MFRMKKDKQAVNEFNQYVKPVSLWADAWKRLKKNKMAFVGLWVVMTYILICFAAPLLTAVGILLPYTDVQSKHVYLPPSFEPAGQLIIEKLDNRVVEVQQAWDEKKATLAPAATGPTTSTSWGSGTQQDALLGVLERVKAEREAMIKDVQTDPIHKRVYILGTDYLGRDLLARTLFGGRLSIMIGIVGTLTAVLIGIVYGSVAGYIGGGLDNFLMRIVDIMYGLPYMLMVIILMAVFRDPSGKNNTIILFVAIAAVSWLTIARVVRGQIMSLKNSEFVEAARSMGAGTPRVIFRHLLPNTLGVVVIFSTLLLPGFIMNESFLSFLGLGVSAPDASWGTLVNDGRNAMDVYPWTLLVPAVAMTIFLFAMNFLGDGLNDALDPQSKNRT